MTQVTTMAIWHASQSHTVRAYAWKLWRTDHGMADGIQSAICQAIERLAWFDPAKGKLENFLILIMKSLRQLERSAGYRRGTTTAPRVVCPGADAMPVMVDLCDPESILIAREINLEEEAAKRMMRSNAKLTSEQVLAIRASNTSIRKLAAQYGVGRTVVAAVKNRQTYKHVGGT